VDTIDRAILRELQANARLTNAELAQRVGLTPAPCLRRVRRLEEDGVLLGYHAEVNPDKVGRAFKVLIDVDLTSQAHSTVEAFESQAVELTEVTEVRRMFGSPDYAFRVEVADLESFEKLLREKIWRLPGVHRVTSHFTMKVLKG
jgi:DNA-binding Lrp family transcriptional regulator